MRVINGSNDQSVEVLLLQHLAKVGGVILSYGRTARGGDDLLVDAATSSVGIAQSNNLRGGPL